MQRNNKQVVFIVVLLIGIGIVLILAYLAFQNVTSTNKQAPAENKIDSVLSDSVDGYITGDGFEFGKMDTEQIYSLTITKEPFEGSLAKAFTWMRDNGLDPNFTPRICFAGSGMTDVTPEQISKCSTASIK